MARQDDVPFILPSDSGVPSNSSSILPDSAAVLPVTSYQEFRRLPSGTPTLMPPSSKRLMSSLDSSPPAKRLRTKTPPWYPAADRRDIEVIDVTPGTSSSDQSRSSSDHRDGLGNASRDAFVQRSMGPAEMQRSGEAIYHVEPRYRPQPQSYTHNPEQSILHDSDVASTSRVPLLPDPQSSSHTQNRYVYDPSTSHHHSHTPWHLEPHQPTAPPSNPRPPSPTPSLDPSPDDDALSCLSSPRMVFLRRLRSYEATMASREREAQASIVKARERSFAWEKAAKEWRRRVQEVKYNRGVKWEKRAREWEGRVMTYASEMKETRARLAGADAGVARLEEELRLVRAVVEKLEEEATAARMSDARLKEEVSTLSARIKALQEDKEKESREFRTRLEMMWSRCMDAEGARSQLVSDMSCLNTESQTRTVEQQEQIAALEAEVAWLRAEAEQRAQEHEHVLGEVRMEIKLASTRADDEQQKAHERLSEVLGLVSVLREEMVDLRSESKERIQNLERDNEIMKGDLERARVKAESHIAELTTLKTPCWTESTTDTEQLRVPVAVEVSGDARHAPSQQGQLWSAPENAIHDPHVGLGPEVSIALDLPESLEESARRLLSQSLAEEDAVRDEAATLKSPSVPKEAEAPSVSELVQTDELQKVFVGVPDPSWRLPKHHSLQPDAEVGCDPGVRMFV